MNAELIRRYIHRTTWSLAALAVARGVLQALLALIPYLGPLLILDHIIEVPSAARRGAWFLGFALGAFFFVRAFWPFSLFRVKSRARRLAASQGNLREDDL